MKKKRHRKRESTARKFDSTTVQQIPPRLIHFVVQQIPPHLIHFVLGVVGVRQAGAVVQRTSDAREPQ